MATAASQLRVSAPLSCKTSEFSGSAVILMQAPPTLNRGKSRALKVVASGGKKVNIKQPYGPSGGVKFRDGVDASGSKAKGKGVYQFGKKYGANVDGYSPIYAEEEWSASGNVYAGGQTGLLLWAVTFGALLLAGALLVYNTSALV